MRRLAADLAAADFSVTTWEQIKNPGFLFPPLAEAIAEHDIFLAETTFGNPNVLFELGYAIAIGKTVLQLEDQNAARPRRLYPLAVVRSIRYEQRADVIQFMTSADLTGAPLSSQIGLDSISPRPGTLYFIPSRRGGDHNEAIWRQCVDSRLDCHTIDTGDTDYDTLSSQAALLAEADIAVTLLVNEDTREFWDNNAQLMLYAGLATGLQTEVITLVEQPLRRLLDLGERLIPFQSETEAEFRLRTRLGSIVTRHLTSPTPRRTVLTRSSPLAGLFLGGLDARADPRLDAYFFEAPEYHQAEAGYRHLFVGGKGSGKTANFQQLVSVLSERNQVVVAVAPADFEFPRLTAVLDPLVHISHWQFVYGSFWRFIFLTEVLRGIKANFLDHLLREASTNESLRDLLRWLDNNESLLAMDFISRVIAVLSQLADISGDDAEKRQRLDETLQAARMYQIEDHLKEFARDFPIRILIDDLDRNWNPASPSANRLILALLNELQALMANQAPNLLTTVFIRKDVFRWLRENDPEILKRDPAFLTWTPEALEMIIASRIYSYTEASETDPESLWASIFPKHVAGERVQDFIISRTLQRPRDVLQFCQRAIEFAQHAGRDAASEDDVRAAWEPFGELTLAQIETEYQHHYPRLGEIVLAFLDRPIIQPYEDLAKRFHEIAANLPDPPTWIRDAQKDPIQFVHALYETGIIGVETPGATRWFDIQRSFSDISPALGGDFRIILHPAFHAYLHCR